MAYNDPKTVEQAVQFLAALGAGDRLILHGRIVGEVAIALQSLDRVRKRVRQITRRSRGVSTGQVIDQLNTFLTGWVTYFRHAECRSALREMDGWVRRKLRCLRLKQCRFMNPIANWLQKLGVPRRRAWLLAQSGRGWWRLCPHNCATRHVNFRWGYVA